MGSACQICESGGLSRRAARSGLSAAAAARRAALARVLRRPGVQPGQREQLFHCGAQVLLIRADAAWGPPRSCALTVPCAARTLRRSPYSACAPAATAAPPWCACMRALTTAMMCSSTEPGK